VGSRPASSVATASTEAGEAEAPVARGTRTAEAITQAAIELFWRHGYEATTLREIAAEVGIQVGSLYNHIPSKEELLFSIMSGVIEDLIAEVEGRLVGIEDPVDRLRAAIECHVMFHTDRAREVFIGNSELRSLSEPNRAAVVRLRDRYESIIASVLRQGSNAGAFELHDVKLTAYAVVSVGTQVSNWYHDYGRLSLPKIAEVYTDLILEGLLPRSRRARQSRPSSRAGRSRAS
jgi:TetR/AcrR family transcriptional regulator, cholesterol catabolism regulator